MKHFVSKSRLNPLELFSKIFMYATRYMNHVQEETSCLMNVELCFSFPCAVTFLTTFTSTLATKSTTALVICSSGMGLDATVEPRPASTQTVYFFVIDNVYIPIFWL